ncbi:hypothetical protein NDU88_004962 [Pleurodeles waltl]|uniref:Uncharacterized protein n=1 Tax=Pleurodeles waltl TaxID=8319 RepID=A0AAV7UJK7_PLEWA|nr:hypothetical protein NDU88_004962 [Pleurodeles waltl]
MCDVYSRTGSLWGRGGQHLQHALHLFKQGVSQCVTAAGTPGYRQWRPPDHLIPRGHRGAGQEKTHLRNPDIQIPVVQPPARRPQRGEDDAEAEEQTEEDDAGTEGKTEREDAETGKRPCEGPHEERSCPEQLTPGENLDEGQGSPETPRLRHVPGGA